MRLATLSVDSSELSTASESKPKQKRAEGLPAQKQYEER